MKRVNNLLAIVLFLVGVFSVSYAEVVAPVEKEAVQAVASVAGAFLRMVSSRNKTTCFMTMDKYHLILEILSFLYDLQSSLGFS